MVQFFRGGLGLGVVATLLLAISSPHLSSATFYCDPEVGKEANPGTKDAPWPGLAVCVSGGKLNNLSGGDTVLLATGSHGEVTLKGDNERPVTIAAAPGAHPKLARLFIPSGKNWVIRGLEISPEGAQSPPAGYMVSVGDRGPTSDVIIEDCFVYTILDASSWTVQDWKEARNGILLGRQGDRLTARNNYVLNTRFGISMASTNSTCEGNVVSDFSADGIRVTRDNVTVAWNIIKNAYVSIADGDANHDDAIQCFAFNKGSEPKADHTVRGVRVENNLILMREDPQQRFPSNFQGVGFFDGPLADFVVEGNVVTLDHYHGISLYDSVGSRISNNTVLNPWGGKMAAWIMLGTKPSVGQVRGNTVTGNRAKVFNLKADAQVLASDNEMVEPETHRKHFDALLSEIRDKFGASHPVANRERSAQYPQHSVLSE